MKFKSQIATQVSGSVGGTTYARNKGGMYMRARGIPVNPSTPEQQAVRNATSQLSARWSDTLTDAQREAWGVYATNVPLIDTLGDSRTVSGMNMYVRSNVIRLQVGLARIDTAPANYTLPTFNVTSVTADDADGTGNVSIAYSAGDAWATAVGGALIVYTSRPQSPGITFFKGPYRYAGRVNGAGTPPVSPQVIIPAFSLAGEGGNALFVAIRCVTPDGRLSGTQRFRTIVTEA